MKDSKLVVALVFLAIIFVATPAGGMAVHSWWTGKLFFGMNVPGYGAIIGLAGVVFGLLRIAGLKNTFRQKNYLVIGEDCFQQVQYGKVIVQISTKNLNATAPSGEIKAASLCLAARDFSPRPHISEAITYARARPKIYALGHHDCSSCLAGKRVRPRDGTRSDF